MAMQVQEFDSGKKVCSFKGEWAKASALERVCAYTYIFVVTHYLFWTGVMALGFYLVWRFVHPVVCIVLLALYTRSFLNNDQFKYGRPWAAYRQSKIWHLTQKYLEVEVTREAPLDPTRKYVFGAYPHGILVLSRVCLYGGVWEALFPGVDFRTLGASPMFYIPGGRELCLWMTAVDAGKKTAMHVLKKSLSIMVYSGGSAEIFKTDGLSKVTTLVLRKGFIKLAIEQGADVVPAFIFGEKWLYNKLMIPQKIRDMLMKTLKTPILLFWGKWFTWVPKQRPLSMVYAPAIRVEQCDNPTDEMIDKVFDNYKDEIMRLFETYKKQYGYDAEETLEFQNAR